MDGSLALAVVAAAARWLGPDFHLPPIGADLAGVLLIAAVITWIAVWLAHRRGGPAAADAAARRIALLAVTLVILAFAAEGATRVILRHVTTSADVRSYFSRRWGKTHATGNRLGFREREFPIDKPAGTYRIAVIGDSFTYGNGVEESERLSNLLDRACAGHGCEVLNFGMPGNATPDNTDTLQRVVLRTHPDFVLLAWFTNDPEATAPPDRPPHFLKLLPWSALEAWLYERSALATLLKIKWADVQLMTWRSDPYVDYMRQRFGNAAGADAREADGELRKFIDVCRRSGAGVGIVLWPHLGLIGPNYPLAFLHRQVLATCAAEKIPCVDLAPILATVKNRRSLWASPLDSHPGLTANQLARDQVLETFAGIWFGNRQRATVER